MAFKTLISTDVLAAHIDDPAFIIIDCRFKLDDERWGEREYTEVHIPGAVYASLSHDLSGPLTGTNGRHPLPDAHALARTLGRLGISGGSQVVAYDQDSGAFASRLWWLLRWLGHDAVAVLDGGFAKWTHEGRPTRGGTEVHEPAVFTGSVRPEMVANVSQVSAHVTDNEWHLVDARAPERYRGEKEPLDKTPGHIPGAVNHFFQWNLNEHGTFRSADALRESFHPVLGDAPADRIVNYCGSGVTACHNLLALEHAGITGTKLYPGSWSEWSADPERPVERGQKI
jgi:thiosulfate/3-mercaptopyruvate sulfurtransferase